MVKSSNPKRLNEKRAPVHSGARLVKVVFDSKNSLDKIKRSNTKSNSIRDKIVIPSFLDVFSQLTKDNIAILADYEEE